MLMADVLVHDHPSIPSQQTSWLIELGIKMSTVRQVYTYFWMPSVLPLRACPGSPGYSYLSLPPFAFCGGFIAPVGSIEASSFADCYWKRAI